MRKRHAAGLGAILMAVALALVMYQARGRDGERADRTLSQQGADRFHQLLQEVEERCSRLQAGDGGIVDRHAVRRDIAALGRFARAHKGAFFPEDAPGVQAELNTVVSYWVWDVSCTDPEARQLHGIVPVPLEPTELSGRERVALALAKTDFRDRCYKRSPSRADERAAERDIATFSRLAARWPPLWDDLGFVMTEPEGGWGDLSPPSAASYFDVDFCRLPEALQLLRNELPVGEDNVFEH